VKIKNLENLQFKAEKGQSILDSALSSGHAFEYSCKNGQCGVCKTTLLEGKVTELLPQTALTEMDKQQNKILSCCCTAKTDLLIDAEDLSALKNIEVKTLPARINKIEKKTAHIIELELRLPPTTKLNFLEGQYIDIIASNGIRRSYSIANSANKQVITLFIKKVNQGKLSEYWFHQAKENDLLRLEGPKGTFFLRENKKQIVFLATGTGIAPIKSILDKLSETDATFDISLYWGNREPEDFFWQPDYANLNLTYKPVLSKQNKAWAGEIGYVQNVFVNNNNRLDNIQIYACGSLEMISSSQNVLMEQGLDEKYFYSEAFVSS